jgi:hypothetical protein
VTTFGLTAAPGLVSRTETHTFMRRQLDEEPTSRSSSTLRDTRIGSPPRCRTPGGRG